MCSKRRSSALAFASISLFQLALCLRCGAAASSPQAAQILTIEGTADIVRAGSADWKPATTNQVLTFGDRFRTGARSRATVRLSDLSVLRVDEKTVLELRSRDDNNGSLLDLLSGSTYFLNRSKPNQLQFRTPLVSGAIRGTEFVLTAADDGPSTVTLLDGEVALHNPQGELVLHSGEQGTIEPGQAPRKTAVLNANNIIQWSLYYPAVVDPDEIAFNDQDRAAVGPAFEAYRRGDLLGARNSLTPASPSASDQQRLFDAALLLAVGQVDQTVAALKALQTPSPLAAALQLLITTVTRQPRPASEPPTTASQWLAESYYRQSQSDLPGALAAAEAATRKSPRFGFAWIRVGELQFSLGYPARARDALAQGLALSPLNAQGLVLQGFLSAADDDIEKALASFNQAIAIDGALANAWLGRGLCEMRGRRYAEGRQDLQTAAALEPNRAEIRSYLGKAWDQTHQRRLAEKELALARQLDPADPTPWLYSSLLLHAYNRENEAISDLEQSKSLNDNRSLYRSRFLLDQDQAVRGANLARFYQDAGLVDVSVREAARAVDQDYANYSAHLFLANSYDALRDPKEVNLRYETPWYSQLLVANLLAPVGTLPLSQNVSHEEYSRLFESDRAGLYSETAYDSKGDWVQSASEYATIGKTSIAFDQYYRSDDGTRTNNDLNQFQFALRLKQEITPQDSLFFEVNWFDYSSGDVAQYYDQRAASGTERISEYQQPNLLAGYHHQWAPGVHSLLLFARLDDSFSLYNPDTLLPITTRNFTTTNIVGVGQAPGSISYHSDLTAFSGEFQQIFQNSIHTLVFGARYQSGDIDTVSLLQRLETVNQTNSSSLRRAGGYGYYSLQPWDPLQLTAGLSYDHLQYPLNNEIAPISKVETDQNLLGPKAGFRFTPLADTTFRGAYSRSLGGVFHDNSIRLEPTQIAGFNQAFRSLIPESVEGLVPGTEFESYGLALDQKFHTRTYLSVAGELLKSKGARTVGTLDAFGPALLDIPSGVHQELRFKEQTLTVNLNQLLGNDLSLGGTYRLSKAQLEDSIPAIPTAISQFFSSTANRTVDATLNQANLYLLWNHSSGLYARLEAAWYQQANHGYAVDVHGDDFWQYNAYLGFRFPRRVAEVQLGLLNLSDRDYKLNPLNLYNDLPRSRMLFASLRLNF